MDTFMAMNKRLPYPDRLAKYAEAFFKEVALLANQLELGLESAQFLRLGQLLIVLTKRQLLLFDPLVQTVLTDTQSGGQRGHCMAALSDLLDRFDLEFKSRLTRVTSH
jgi:hypothetical protein